MKYKTLRKSIDFLRTYVGPELVQSTAKPVLKYPSGYMVERKRPFTFDFLEVKPVAYENVGRYNGKYVATFHTPDDLIMVFVYDGTLRSAANIMEKKVSIL